MIVRLLHLLMVLFLLVQVTPVDAREGDTLLPIQIEAPALETFPENLMAEADFNAIESRVIEARNAGVPVAVRIIDVTQQPTDIPFPIRQFARDDFSQPVSTERQQAITDAWFEHESIESSDGARDGFLLLVLAPEDRTQTRAIWGIAPNALPLNGLTQENISATQNVMNTQFAQGNMPNGVYLGMSEFSYNVQFGVPARVERSDIKDALHRAVMPLAIITALAGLLVPALAWWLARKNNAVTEIHYSLTPWQAAALHMKRATPAITAAMLMDGLHRGSLTPGMDGSVRLSPEPGNAATEALRPVANPDGIVPAEAMMEVNAITASVREQIENDLAAIGAMTPRVHVDRTWMLLVIGIAVALAAMLVVPTVASMSALGVYAIAIVIAGVTCGWWWIAHRRHTSPAGDDLLNRWLELASPADRLLFDSVINLDLLTDPIGGPDVTDQMLVVRQLRGLGAG